MWVGVRGCTHGMWEAFGELHDDEHSMGCGRCYNDGLQGVAMAASTRKGKPGPRTQQGLQRAPPTILVTLMVSSLQQSALQCDDNV